MLGGQFVSRGDYTGFFVSYSCGYARPGRMLFAGDAGANLMGLGDPLGFESLKEGRASQRKLASLSFDAAGFGHGKPIAREASTLFRNKWGQKSPA